MKSEASHGEFFFASSGIHQPTQVYAAWSLKRSSLVTSGKFCYFIVELFHAETWQGGGRVAEPGAPSFPGFLFRPERGNTAEVFPPSALLGSFQKTREEA